MTKKFHTGVKLMSFLNVAGKSKEMSSTMTLKINALSAKSTSHLYSA